MTAPVYQWQPSTAEIARRAGIAPDDVIRFDHNTSPAAPPRAAAWATAGAEGLNEYPAADYRPLRAAAAAYAGVAPHRVVPGAGADELITLCALAFLPPGGTAALAEPTYTLYRIATMQRGGTVVTVARNAPDFAQPPGLADAAATSDLTWMCVPHNPSGRREPDAVISEVITAAKGVAVIDAAYAQFAADDWAPWLERHDNLVVLFTMSKAFGLAGIRVGYSISSPELAAGLHAVRPPGSISNVSQALAVRALGEPQWAERNVEMLAAERERMRERLGSLGLRVLPSQTNFLLCEVGTAALVVEEELLAQGLVVRCYRTGPLTQYLRFTIRRPGENDRLLAALAEVLP